MRRRRTIYRHCEKALKRGHMRTDVFQIVLAKRQPPRIRVEVMLGSEMMHSSWQSSKASQFTTEGTFLEVRCEKSFSSLQDQSLLSSSFSLSASSLAICQTPETREEGGHPKGNQAWKTSFFGRHLPKAEVAAFIGAFFHTSLELSFYSRRSK